MGLIVDSSILIAGQRKGLDVHGVLEWLASSQAVRDEIAVSVITVMELQHGAIRADSDVRRQTRGAFMQQLGEVMNVFPVSFEIAMLAGRIDAELAVRGLHVATPDLLIGATALSLGYGVLTHNVRHFAMVPGLEIITI